MSKKKRIVVKIGSSLLANEEKLTLRYAFMNGLMADLGDLQDQGYEIILTSSGSVALGLNMIGKRPEEAGILDKQAAAACGQPLLMNAYRQVANEYNFDVAQMLVTVEDMEERRRFLNIKNTMLRLFENQILPIINENDSIATRDLKVGDNDRLSAKVAQMVEADHLIILTSVEGLYDRDPSEPGAQFIEEIEDVSEHLESTKSISELGSGGMLTKMQAANMAQNAGCTTLIANGEHEAPVSSVLYNERPHTKCLAHTKPASAWAAWLTDRLQIAGSIVIRDELANSLSDSPEHVLHEDIKSIQGQYVKGDVIHVYDESGAEIARGMTNFSSEETMVLARHPEISPKELLGYQTGGTVISRENLIVLEDRHLLWDKPDQETMVEVSET